MPRSKRWLSLAATLPLFLLAACSTAGQSTAATPTPTPTVMASPTTTSGTGIPGRHAYTPEQMRAAYGVTALYDKGFRGKGQTVVVIDSFGSPTLQQDMDTFNQHYGLPAITLKILAPLGTKPYDSNNKEMRGWVGETSEDVELIHAIAPDAAITVLTSPVDETEGTIGLPEFLRLEQYAVSRQLGSIISQSWGASEYTLKDSAGQQEIQRWDAFFQQATTQKGITFFAGSGDSGATDAANLASDRGSIQLVHAPTSSFPNDSPWVTSVGGTTLNPTTSGGYTESAWNESGGGFSAFHAEPDYQRQLPSALQSQLNNRRGLPDVAAAADPATGLDGVFGGTPFVTNGTSAGGPTWSALTAIANQMAGRSLGFLNPALYKLSASAHYAQAFRDVTSGNNTVYDAGGQVIAQGYPAVAGWDAVTGLGTPLADHLLPDLIAAMGA
ncbi:MAG: S53 family peptidase [Ktedonobacterales bacterium]|nr:S53 family peptidase [Ktedonobacterales bacterium]